MPEIIDGERQPSAAFEAYVKWKTAGPCADCGKEYPYWVMQADHRPGEPKLFNLSVGKNRRSLAAVEAELKKCDRVCANCHAERTWSRKAEKPVEELKQGDLIQIEWVDISEDPVGDPDKASLVHRTSFGLFWKTQTEGTTPVLITTTTLDGTETPGQQGFCIYPEACITKISFIRKAKSNRRGRGKHRNAKG